MLGESAYIDTSILGAYYCPEPLSTKAETALQRIGTPIVSVLSEVEFCSLISRKRRLRELSESQAKDILDLFGNHIAEGFYRRMPLGTEHYTKARQLLSSMQASLHALDALHLAAAISESAALLTADKTLATAAKRFKCRLILVK